MSKRYIKVTVNAQEEAAIKALAAGIGQPVSKICREAVLGRDLPKPAPVVPAINRDAYIQLCGVANNLNQIAHVMNTGGSTDVNNALVALANAVKTMRNQLIGKPA